MDREASRGRTAIPHVTGSKAGRKKGPLMLERRDCQDRTRTAVTAHAGDERHGTRQGQASGMREASNERASWGAVVWRQGGRKEGEWE